ncbi:CHAT domain-containing protein [Marinobacter salsuginis]|uniref:CHAT domain-containing protein n=1 Tax=Marinobacter salsuginis TaxID=418719 RepID=UPI001C967C6F|nr:CHAT domain-containing protein [Marinobacter salsuginis]MBY6070115.1 CHAT domain-containing protein [Marinobacter salsuginis]
MAHCYVRLYKAIVTVVLLVVIGSAQASPLGGTLARIETALDNRRYIDAYALARAATEDLRVESRMVGDETNRQAILWHRTRFAVAFGEINSLELVNALDVNAARFPERAIELALLRAQSLVDTVVDIKIQLNEMEEWASIGVDVDQLERTREKLEGVTEEAKQAIIEAEKLQNQNPKITRYAGWNHVIQLDLMIAQGRFEEVRAEASLAKDKLNASTAHGAHGLGLTLAAQALALALSGDSSEKVLEESQLATRLLQDSVGPEHPDTLKAMELNAALLSNNGRSEEAVEIALEVLATKERMLTTPGLEKPHDLFLTYMLSGETVAGHGRTDKTVSLAIKAGQAVVRNMNSDDPKRTEYILSIDQWFNGYLSKDEAAEIMEALVLSDEAIISKKNPGYPKVLNSTAERLREIGRHDEAKALRRQAAMLIKEEGLDELEGEIEDARADGTIEAAERLEHLGEKLNLIDKPYHLYRLYSASADIKEAVLGVDNSDSFLAANIAAAYLDDAGFADEGLSLLNAYIQRLMEKEPRDHSAGAMILSAYADALDTFGETDAASEARLASERELRQKSIKQGWAELETLREDPSKFAMGIELATSLLLEDQLVDEAIDLQVKLIAITLSHKEASNLDTTVSIRLFSLANILDVAGRDDEAVKVRWIVGNFYSVKEIHYALCDDLPTLLPAGMCKLNPAFRKVHLGELWLEAIERRLRDGSVEPASDFIDEEAVKALVLYPYPKSNFIQSIAFNDSLSAFIIAVLDASDATNERMTDIVLLSATEVISDLIERGLRHRALYYTLVRLSLARDAPYTALGWLERLQSEAKASPASELFSVTDIEQIFEMLTNRVEAEKGISKLENELHAAEAERSPDSFMLSPILERLARQQLNAGEFPNALGTFRRWALLGSPDFSGRDTDSGSILFRLRLARDEFESFCTQALLWTPSDVFRRRGTVYSNRDCMQSSFALRREHMRGLLGQALVETYTRPAESAVALRKELEMYLEAMIEFFSSMGPAGIAKAQDMLTESMIWADQVRTMGSNAILRELTQWRIPEPPMGLAADNMEPAPTANLRKAIRGDVALISYFFGHKKLHAWTVHDETIDYTVLDSEIVDLSRKADIFRNSVTPNTEYGSATGSVEVDIGHDLFEDLLEPLVDNLNDTKRLIFIADSFLHSLPFAALPIKAPVSATWTPNEGWRPIWLIDRFEVSFLPSAELAITYADRELRYPKLPFIGYGGPKISATAGFPDLPSAREEVLAIAGFYETTPELTITGKNFTKASVVGKDLKDYGALLFATHNSLQAEQSGKIPPGLVVRDNASSTFVTLTPPEIGALELTASIVVMSACTTSSDANASAGDGLGGLTAAFLKAGARNVVGTHWPIMSEAAPRITVPMFQKIAKESQDSAVTALREAMLGLIHDETEPRFSHPAYWAGFFLVGDGKVGVQ